MKLYYAPASPYARKVRVLAHELQISLELRQVNALDTSDEYGKINPINRVPALRTTHGDIIFDSRVICEYLIANSHSGQYLPEGNERWSTLVTQALGDGIMDAAVPRRHELLRPPEQQSTSRLKLYERSIFQILDHLEATGAPKSFDLGGISVACALLYLDFRFPSDRWTDMRPNLSSWLQSVCRFPSIENTTYT